MNSAAFATPESACLQGLLADMLLAGIAFDVADEPAFWGQPAPRVVASPAEGGGRRGADQSSAPLEPLRPEIPALRAALELTQAAPMALPEPAAGDIWHHGEPGGLVVVLEAPQPPTGDAAVLLENILKACGFAALPRGFVGVRGGVVAPGAAEAPVAALQPQRVLVLGEAMVAAYAGQKDGVEGWHRGGGTAGVGVTYPLALMLQNPMFKRRAWQHLQLWMATDALTYKKETADAA